MPVGLRESKRPAWGTQSYNERVACYALPLYEPATMPQQRCTEIYSMTGTLTACFLLCCRGGRGGGRGRGRGGAGGRGGRGGKRNVKDMTAEQKQVGLAQHLCVSSCPASAGAYGQVVQATTRLFQATFCWWVRHDSVAVCGFLSTCSCVWAGTPRPTSGSLW